MSVVVKFSESAPVAASPEKAWQTASDLSRLGDWMSMHEAWRGELPDKLDAGVELTSVVNVKGLRNRVTWKIESYNAPESLVLRGEGVGGTKVSLELAIRPEGEGSRVSFDVDFSGKLVVGPIGMTVKRALKGDVRSSIKKLTELIASIMNAEAPDSIVRAAGPGDEG
jgi:carbon monoxide dehydrogenase subunit G